MPKTIPKAVRVLIVITTVICIFAMLSMIAFSVYTSVSERERHKKFEELSWDLQIERQKLLRQYYNIEKDVISSLPCGTIMSIVVRGTDRLLYDKIFPILKGSDPDFPALVGMIVLTPDELPGDEGNITLEELREMLEAGWSIAVGYDGFEDLDEYLDGMAELLSERCRLNMPETVYFDYNQYTRGYDDILASHNIECVIHHEEEGLPLISTDLEAPVWRVGAFPWNSGGQSSTLYSEFLTGNGNLVFSVGFEPYMPDYIVDETIAIESFTRMIEQFRGNAHSNHMAVASVPDARDLFEVHRMVYDEKIPYIDAMKAVTKKSIEEVERKLIELYESLG